MNFADYFLSTTAQIMSNGSSNVLPKDIQNIGLNEQGFPILYSPSSKISTQFITIDWSKHETQVEPNT